MCLPLCNIAGIWFWIAEDDDAKLAFTVLQIFLALARTSRRAIVTIPAG
jgi:hypothetical protein